MSTPTRTDTEGAEAPAPQLPQHYRPVTSSNLKAIAWLGAAGEDLYAAEEAQTGTIEVMFGNGNRWRYKGVPRETAHGLLTAESVGKFFNNEIKSRPEYPAEKIDDQQAGPEN
jgi:hypothetical protein